MVSITKNQFRPNVAFCDTTFKYLTRGFYVQFNSLEITKAVMLKNSRGFF